MTQETCGLAFAPGDGSFVPKERLPLSEGLPWDKGTVPFIHMGVLWKGFFVDGNITSFFHGKRSENGRLLSQGRRAS